MSSVESYQFQTLPNKMTNFLFLCFISTGQSVLQQFDMVQRARNPEMMGLGKVDIWEPTNMQHVSTTPATVQLLRALLSYDQRKRPNATAALRSSIFDEWYIYRITFPAIPSCTDINFRWSHHAIF